MTPKRAVAAHLVAALLYTIAPAWHFRMAAIHASLQVSAAELLVRQPLWLLALFPGVFSVAGAMISSRPPFRLAGWVVTVAGVAVMMCWSLLGCAVALGHVRDLDPALTSAWVLSVTGSALGAFVAARWRPSASARARRSE
jgi:hypothetical protein